MNILTKTLRIAAALLLGITSGCSRKAEQVAPLTPEVLVATVMPKDVPVLKEGVATLEGFITANINAQEQGYITSRDYKEGSLVKKGDLLFQIDPRPFEATLDQAKGNLAVAHSNQTKADVDELRKIVKKHEEEFVDNPSRDEFLRLMEEQPQASFYTAVPQKDVVVYYCRDAQFGVWVLVGSGIGPLDADGKLLMKEAIEGPLTGPKLGG